MRYEYNATTGETIELPDLPVVLAPIEDRCAAVWEQIKAKRNFLMQDAVFAGGYWFDSDADSRIKHLWLFMLGANIPAGQMFKTKDNQHVEMTQALAAELAANTALWDSSVFFIGEDLRLEVEASDNPELVDIESAWPTGYVSGGAG